jgi:type VI protein secretion system component VasK
VLDHSLDETRSDAVRSRFVPRFTIRTLLVIITVCAIIFVMVGTATRGQYWAWGVTIGLVSLIVTALTHAACFGIVSLCSRMSLDRPQFSEGVLRQIMAPPASEAATDAGVEEHSAHDGQPKPQEMAP